MIVKHIESILEFHRLYFDKVKSTGENTSWMGKTIAKCPLDLWIYQELIFRLKPDFVIETGTYKSGSALFIANIMDLVNHGRVVTIDIKSTEEISHPRITYISGDSTSNSTIEKVKKIVDREVCNIVILDSHHSKQHVYKELELYSQFVTKNSYMIVEDTNINGNPVMLNYGPGPNEAVREFLSKTFLLTYYMKF